jgi:hypothetical protein
MDYKIGTKALWTRYGRVVEIQSAISYATQTIRVLDRLHGRVTVPLSELVETEESKSI